MATVNAELPTLLDIAKRMDPNGSIATLVELISKENSIIQDAVFKEGNLPTGHRISSRNALPAVGWRKYNEGVTPGKSRTTQADESVGMLEGMSVVDTELARLNGNEAAFRLSEDRAFIQALNNEVETGFFYHSTAAAPEKFKGFAPRLDATSGNPFSNQIILAEAGSGADQTSAWLVGWGPNTVYGIYPRGSMMGIETVDMGRQLWDDGTGKKFTAWVTNWKWKIGLAVEDGRYLVRVANIDTGDLAANEDIIIPAMIRATHQLKSRNGVRPVWYVNRKLYTYLHLQAREKAANTLSVANVAGEPITSLLGIPIRMTDALLNTEALVS